MKTSLAQPTVRPSDETPAIPLQMAPKRRGKPPRHFADLTPEERVASVVEAGEPAFRAKQLATHYFTHYTSDATKMTDLPASSREALATTMFPELMRPDLVRPATPSQAFGLPTDGVAAVSFEGLPVQMPLDVTEVNPDGMLGGDPTLADAAIGARVVEHITGFTARFVAHFRRCDPRRVEAAPA